MQSPARSFMLATIYWLLATLPATLTHAAIAAPPGILQLAGVAAGPRCFLSLNQKAVNQTLAPAAVPAGKATSNEVRVILPSNFQPDSSSGALAPTKLKMAAPSTPAGLPRRVGLAGSCRRRRTVLPLAEMMSMSGALAGGGKGGGPGSRAGKPRADFFAVVTAGGGRKIRGRRS